MNSFDSPELFTQISEKGSISGCEPVIFVSSFRSGYLQIGFQKKMTEHCQHKTDK